MLLSAIAVGSWTGLYLLISEASPAHSVAVASFYGLLFLGLASSLGVLAWAAVPAETEDGGRVSPLRYLGHTMLFSSLLLFALWLQSLRMLTSLNAGLLLALYALMELTVLLGRRWDGR